MERTICNDLAIAYRVYSTDVTYNRNTGKFDHGQGSDSIITRSGVQYTKADWIAEGLKKVKNLGLQDIFEAVKEYVTVNHVWLKREEIVEHALDCLFHESYKRWDDFSFQERIF